MLHHAWRYGLFRFSLLGALVALTQWHWVACVRRRPRFPDARNFAAQSNGLPPFASSFDHLYAPLPTLPDDFTIARVPFTSAFIDPQEHEQQQQQQVGHEFVQPAFRALVLPGQPNSMTKPML